MESNPSIDPAPEKGGRGGTPHSKVTGLVDRLRHGDTRALARAISLVENDAPEAAALLSACFPHTGRALRIGITGSPGAGKSTLVDRLARSFRDSGKTIGVVAVDPTSPFTGGAILGDRIRFQDRNSDSGFYARSMATRGSLGGLALSTADVALVLEASGKDVLLIETVGVGQDEVEIARLADITLVVLVPGMGDDVQSLKAGVMEIADIFVVNKSDREGADRVEQEIRGLQSLVSSHPERTPPVLRTIATTGEGVPALAAAIDEMEKWLRQEKRLEARRAQHWQRRLDAMLRAELMRRARNNGFDASVLQFHANRIANGQQDPWQLVAQLTEKVFSAGNSP
ncbi:MAG: methylmalonyl Co-A mutase-associated GTPase MeaB [Acidobacteriaceae bacterium]